MRLPPAGNESRSPPEPSERITDEISPPGSSPACSTNAPAPSPNKMQVFRSCQLTKRDSVSAPITTAFWIDPLRIACVAISSAKIKPEQAADRSNAPAWVAPILSCTRHAVAGNICSGEEVDTMIKSISVGFRLATLSAFKAASLARVAVDSSSLAI